MFQCLYTSDCREYEFISNIAVQLRSPIRWNRTTLILISYGFEACTPDHWLSSVSLQTGTPMVVRLFRAMSGYSFYDDLSFGEAPWLRYSR
ncbi:hypothetical protein CEXT_604451 [Caerostris extrusa]|uniref:Uncharacterized protein n=1 Tax=Caerostris extrusa TaxID=172846 RepID=A0AAV4RG25_CAEEX|nr:hypothetical protein CEXT_604451 [Caerostris extrusa]